VSEILVTVYDRTNGEEEVGTYRTLVAPRIGDLLTINAEPVDRLRMLRIEDVYWMVFPVHAHNAVSHGSFKAGPVDSVTVFGRVAEGPFKA
jgi:hypothetical protein